MLACMCTVYLCIRCKSIYIISNTEILEFMELENDTAAVVKTPNPLMARLNKMPGVTIRLPSRGLFYSNGELDDECVSGEVNIFPMTTTDELMMRSPDMLFQGTAIDHVIKRCLPQIKKPLELLVGDIDYILTQLRRVSYGSHIPITYDCDCMTEEERKLQRQSGDNEYLIPVEHFIQNTKELDVKDFNKQFKIELTNGQRVTLQPLRFCDFIKIQQMQDPEAMKVVENIKEFVATNFAAVTRSVDEIEDKELIKEWYRELPRLQNERIKKKLDSIDHWGIEFKYAITCNHCKQSKELTTQLNPVYFFMLPSSPETLV
jgi:hypothetical protein